MSNFSVYDYKTEKARKDVPYDEYGDTFKYKVANMDKIVAKIKDEREKADMSMIINVKAIRTRREKEISKIIRFAKDPLTGIHYGLIVGSLPDGNVKWRGIYLTDHNSFDLNNDLEAKCFAVLRMHPALKGCPYLTTEDPMFEILDPNQIANEKFTRAMELGKALQVIKNMEHIAVLPFARFMEIYFDESMASTRYVKSLLTDKAQENPSAFIKNFYDPNRPLFEMIAVAKYHGIITFSSDTGHSIGTTQLGYSLPDVARTLETQTMYTARIRTKLNEIGAVLNEEEIEEIKEEVKEDTGE